MSSWPQVEGQHEGGGRAHADGGLELLETPMKGHRPRMHQDDVENHQHRADDHEKVARHDLPDWGLQKPVLSCAAANAQPPAGQGFCLWRSPSAVVVSATSADQRRPR